MSGTPLSQAEVNDLAAGARVLVTWSGGNGPHEYTVQVDKWGNRAAYAFGVFCDYLTEVGQHPLTQVWLI